MTADVPHPDQPQSADEAVPPGEAVAAQVISLRARLGKANARLDTLRQERDTLRTRVETLKDRSGTLQTEKDQLRADKDRVRAEKDQLRADKEQLRADKEQLHRTLSLRRDELLKERKEQRRKLEEHQQSAAERIAGLENARSRLLRERAIHLDWSSGHRAHTMAATIWSSYQPRAAKLAQISEVLIQAGQADAALGLAATIGHGTPTDQWMSLVVGSRAKLELSEPLSKDAVATLSASPERLVGTLRRSPMSLDNSVTSAPDPQSSVWALRSSGRTYSESV